MKGTVRFFDDRKSYGFIEPDEEEEDHFVHKSDIQGAVSLQEGDRVEFKSEFGDRGFKALHVRKIEK